MLKLFKNKKAQNTAEYAILIALVVGGVIAMQTYAQRALQGRIRDASVLMANVPGSSSGVSIGNTAQYEPYYSETASQVTKDSAVSSQLVNGFGTSDATTNTAKDIGSYEKTTYNTALINAPIL